MKVFVRKPAITFVFNMISRLQANKGPSCLYMRILTLMRSLDFYAVHALTMY